MTTNSRNSGAKPRGDYGPGLLLHYAVGLGKDLSGPRQTMEFLAWPVIDGRLERREDGDDIARERQCVLAIPVYVAYGTS
jgi:hypothetical protein